MSYKRDAEDLLIEMIESGEERLMLGHSAPPIAMLGSRPSKRLSSSTQKRIKNILRHIEDEPKRAKVMRLVVKGELTEEGKKRGLPVPPKKMKLSAREQFEAIREKRKREGGT